MVELQIIIIVIIIISKLKKIINTIKKNHTFFKE